MACRATNHGRLQTKSIPGIATLGIRELYYIHTIMLAENVSTAETQNSSKRVDDHSKSPNPGCIKATVETGQTMR